MGKMGDRPTINTMAAGNAKLLFNLIVTSLLLIILV